VSAAASSTAASTSSGRQQSRASNTRSSRGSQQIPSRASSVANLVESIFKALDIDQDGKITVEEAGKILLRLNSRLGRSYGEDDVIAFYSALDVNNDGSLNFEVFRTAFLAIAANN
jgi:Ca2+-binding EF-hand superfamily protein